MHMYSRGGAWATAREGGFADLAPMRAGCRDAGVRNRPEADGRFAPKAVMSLRGVRSEATKNQKAQLLAMVQRVFRARVFDAVGGLRAFREAKAAASVQPAK